MSDRLITVGVGGFKGSGKSEVARALVARGCRVHKFAAPLKAMLAALGLDDRHLEGDLKEEPCDLLCGRTPREAMITLGTEWGRDLIDSEIWVRAWARSAGVDPIVADDVRFPNEVATIKGLGGVVVWVERPGLSAGDHRSEVGIAGDADVTIVNDGTLADLRAKIDRLADDLGL